MHPAQRTYVVLVLTAVLAIAGVWSDQADLASLWRVPALLLLIGVAVEGYLIGRTEIRFEVQTVSHALLGRQQSAAFVFHNDTSRAVLINFAPVLPVGLETGTPGQDRPRKVLVPRRGIARDAFELLPLRLGSQRWPSIPARLLGPLRLVWWTRDMASSQQISVAPDVLRTHRNRPRGNPLGARPRRVVGAGSELHQLRGYLRGDPLARIDWKATARTRRLVTREFSEDQHLDVLVAIDAGRLSRVRAGRLDRLGLYANIAARLAEVITPNDDRVGLVVFADRPVAMCAPDRGLPAVMRVRRALEGLQVQAAESDPIAAAMRIRSMLRHRSLVVLLTDLDDVSVADERSRAVRLLSPPHLVVVAGVRNREIEELARREARNWSDPWIALAAREHEARAESQRILLRRMGAPVVAAREEVLEQAVLGEYESLRRARRV